MSAARQSLGRQGEELAATFIAALGWPILERNWRTRGGEIDLVTRDGDWLVLVEVRARRGGRFGRPEESIDRRKQRRLLQLGARYMQQVDWHGPWRIDVMALEFPEGGRSDGLRSTSPTASSAAGRQGGRPGPAADSAAEPRSSLPPLDPSASSAATGLAPEHLLPGGVVLRHLRHAVSP